MNWFQRILVIVSGLAFLALMLSPLSGLFNKSPEPQSNTGNPNSAPPEEQIKAIAKGYEQVLKREPNNPVALQGLAEARLKMRDHKGAIDPLEKLSKLYPEETKLKALLEAIKKEVIAEEKAKKSQPSATPKLKSEGKNSPIPIPSPSSLPDPFASPSPSSLTDPFASPSPSSSPGFPSF